MVPLGAAPFILPAPKEMPLPMHCNGDPEVILTLGTARCSARLDKEPRSQDAALHPRRETP